MLQSLFGKVAIANAKIAYLKFQEILPIRKFPGPEKERSESPGVLWPVRERRTHATGHLLHR